METRAASKGAGSVRKRLQKLLRSTIKCFYQPKDLLIIDLLIKEQRVSEQRFESILKLDIKLLRVSLIALREDHLISKRTVKTSVGNRKWRRIDYYTIKYGNLVDVVRFKLDNVHKRVETLERQSVDNRSFHCKPCDKSWTDMEAGELFNMTSKRFCCTICRKPVEGNSGEIGSQIRLLMSRFNEEASPVYLLLKECEV